MSNSQMISVPRDWLTSVALLQMPLDELQDQAAEFLAEQHQGDPVALPARKPWNGLLPTADNLKGEGYNACIDEIAKLGPLYTRPAQGEPVAWVNSGAAYSGQCFATSHRIVESIGCSSPLHNSHATGSPCAGRV